MNLKTCMFTESDCYKAGRTVTPKGVMVHSTGADNPRLARYVQPDDGLLGDNPNGNHWNRPGVSKCVHAFIGRAADGTVAVYQTLPWDRRGWHCGGAGNDTHISFELCEDALEDEDYFRRVYDAAVELTAHLCRTFSLDPLADGVVIDHREGHLRGIASAHGDVAHWFSRFGKTMDDFRAAVAEHLAEDTAQAEFDRRMDGWLARRAALPPALWSETDRAWAVETGLFRGDGAGELAWKSFCTREELAALLHRLQETGGETV